MNTNATVMAEVRALRRYHIGGREVLPGHVHEVDATVAAELVENGKAVLTDPDTRHVVEHARKQQAARSARTFRGAQVPYTF
jgi:hypothetical protein